MTKTRTMISALGLTVLLILLWAAFAVFLAPSAQAANMPRKVWIGGDSMAYQLRPTLEAKLRTQGVAAVPWLCKSSSGIVRTDFMNWPNAARAQMTKHKPNVTVFMIGTNDHQPITAKGKVYQFGTTGWKAIYRTRVAAIMKSMLSNGAERVYWIGMPIMGSSSFGGAMKVLNGIYRSEASKRGGHVTYVDAWKLFSGSGGGYVSSWRASDGIHFSISGVERLADALVAQMKSAR
jgi:hypothetical protein